MNNRIKELREREHLSQSQLGDKLHVTQQSISKWEGNDMEVPMGVAIDLAECFKVSLDYLMCQTPDPIVISEEMEELIQKLYTLNQRDRKLIFKLIENMMEE